VTRAVRLAVSIAALLAVHFAMWCAVPFILDGPLLPSDTFGQRLVNIAVMAAWMWGLPLALLFRYERQIKQRWG
jgi:hypothetical protein